MKKGSVLPLNVNPGFLPRHFVESLVLSYRAIPHLMPIQMETSAMLNLARTRNGKAFLASDAEWALLLDSDMMWGPEAILRLLKTAKEKKLKAVSGFTLMDHSNRQVKRVVPHAYQIIPTGNGGYAQAPYAAIPMDGPFKVHAVGGACFLVHRDVYQDVADMSRGKTAYLWQEDVYQPKLDEQMGEDLAFCQRVRKAGHEIWYEPRAVFLHQRKPQFLGLKEYVDSLESLDTKDVLVVDADILPADEE